MLCLVKMKRLHETPLWTVGWALLFYRLPSYSALKYSITQTSITIIYEISSRSCFCIVVTSVRTRNLHFTETPRPACTDWILILKCFEQILWTKQICIVWSLNWCLLPLSWGTLSECHLFSIFSNFSWVFVLSFKG